MTLRVPVVCGCLALLPTIWADIGDLNIQRFSFDIVDMSGYILISENTKDVLDISTLSKEIYILRVKNRLEIGMTVFVKE